MADRLNSDTPMTNNIRLYLKELEGRIGEEKTKKFVTMFGDILDKLDEANQYTDYRFKKFPDKENNVKFTLEVMVDIMDFEDDDPEFAVRCRDKDTDEVKFLWSYEKFLERLDLMRDWYDDLQDDGILNRVRFVDPWSNVSGQDSSDRQDSWMREHEEQIKRIKEKLELLKKRKGNLDKQSEKFKGKVNKILAIPKLKPDAPDATLI